MHRIDAPGATATNEFTDGDPVNAIPATTLWSKWLNTLQRELANLVEGLGLTLDQADDTQVLTSIFKARRNRNLIINGNFDFWQRATSAASSVVGAWLYLTADRWATRLSAASGTVSSAQQVFTTGQTSVPGDPAYYLRTTLTAGNTITAYELRQAIEDVRTAAGKTVTVSFYMRADAAQNVTARLSQEFGAGGSAAVSTALGTLALTANWQSFSLKATLPDLVGKTIGVGDFMALVFDLPKTVASYVDISRVKVEESTVATEFSRAGDDIQGELAMCQRYFEKSYESSVVPGTATNNGALGFHASALGQTQELSAQFSVTKRSIPTITLYSSSGVSGSVTNQDGADPTATPGNISEHSFMSITLSSVPVAGHRHEAQYTADSEL